jgi:hypothetical protein
MIGRYRKFFSGPCRWSSWSGKVWLWKRVHQAQGHGDDCGDVGLRTINLAQKMQTVKTCSIMSRYVKICQDDFKNKKLSTKGSKKS